MITEKLLHFSYRLFFQLTIRLQPKQLIGIICCAMFTESFLLLVWPSEVKLALNTAELDTDMFILYSSLHCIL